MFFKYHIFIFFLFIFISGCQLKEPLKPHGIMYLENRSNELNISKSNKNDVIKIIGRPHIKDNQSDETWIYFERILSKGKFHKLGQHVLKENNVLVLIFDKYGVLTSKDFLDKEEMNDLKFSTSSTENILQARVLFKGFYKV